MSTMMKYCIIATFIILFPELLFANDIDKSPNLLIIMTDEHNIRTLGCYRELMDESQAFVWGNGVKVDTPNIDRLASQGALLTNYNVASPTCTPSRASFFSGVSWLYFIFVLYILMNYTMTYLYFLRNKI